MLVIEAIRLVHRLEPTMETTTRPGTPLRHRMLDDMRMRKFAEHTQDGYIRAVRKLAAFLGRSPDTATIEDLRRFQLHLVDAGTGPVTINAAITGLKFFFEEGLKLPPFAASRRRSLCSPRAHDTCTRDANMPGRLPGGRCRVRNRITGHLRFDPVFDTNKAAADFEKSERERIRSKGPLYTLEMTFREAGGVPRLDAVRGERAHDPAYRGVAHRSRDEDLGSVIVGPADGRSGDREIP
jgi:hypothetical protein